MSLPRPLFALIFVLSAAACGDDDTTPVDAGADASPRDAAVDMAPLVDMSRPDAGTRDSGTVDGAAVDSGTVDAGLCGDGNVDGTEQCDRTDLNGRSCASEGFSSGTLACTAACTFDVTACVLDPCVPRTFTVTSDGASYSFDGVRSAGLVLCPGVTYQFDMAAVSSAHPMDLRTAGAGGATLATMTPGTTTPYLMPAVAPFPEIYICQIHGFSGTIAVP